MGAQKKSESQKAKALWAMKAAWDRIEEQNGPVLVLVFGSYFIARRGGCNGMQYCGREDFCKVVGKALLGRRLTLPGPMGRCAFAHIIQLLECPGEVWATQRAFLLPYQ